MSKEDNPFSFNSFAADDALPFPEPEKKVKKKKKTKTKREPSPAAVVPDPLVGQKVEKDGPEANPFSFNAFATPVGSPSHPDVLFGPCPRWSRPRCIPQDLKAVSCHVFEFTSLNAGGTIGTGAGTGSAEAETEADTVLSAGAGTGASVCGPTAPKRERVLGLVVFRLRGLGLRHRSK